MAQDFIDVRGAAKRLGVSPRRVRQLLEGGLLNGERMGGAWLVSAADVERRLRRPSPVGQPLGQAVAWAVLAQIEGRDESWWQPSRLHPEERARVARHAQRPFDELAPLLVRRASVERRYVHPGLLAGLAADEAALEGGSRAAAAQGAAVAEEQVRQLYVRGSAAGPLMSDTQAVVSNEPNVIFQMVDDDRWPFTDSDSWVWPSVAVLDLYDQGARSLQEALRIWPGKR
jgi:excisionase family DNA binding protein